ncbi:hypothetical protein D3C72_1165310 [compost metagenome]
MLTKALAQNGMKAINLFATGKFANFINVIFIEIKNNGRPAHQGFGSGGLIEANHDAVPVRINTIEIIGLVIPAIYREYDFIAFIDVLKKITPPLRGFVTAVGDKNNLQKRMSSFEILKDAVQFRVVKGIANPSG